MAREINHLIEQHIQVAIATWGVPPECYGIKPKSRELVGSTDPETSVATIDIKVPKGLCTEVRSTTVFGADYVLQGTWMSDIPELFPEDRFEIKLVLQSILDGRLPRLIPEKSMLLTEDLERKHYQSLNALMNDGTSACIFALLTVVALLGTKEHVLEGLWEFATGDDSVTRGRDSLEKSRALAQMIAALPILSFEELSKLIKNASELVTEWRYIKSSREQTIPVEALAQPTSSFFRYQKAFLERIGPTPSDA